MALSKQLQTELVHRLHRLEGHVRGVVGMIERREPYDQVVVQLTALKAAVNQVIVRLLEGQLDGLAQAQGPGGPAEDPAEAAEAAERLKKALSLALRHS